ncbi:amidase [Bacilli bacterium]|nr:amidase [Bacilli bacterium VT-13-104]PZD89746.1 amidase [Bacilli bacterium]PZD91268.1 amidase [Bacilli bacterium]PZD92815.1 amidase [Bacilli bacterium]RCO05658.1 amidase [Bacilli bacterium]
MDTTAIIEMDASSTASAIRKGELTSTEAVTAYIKHINVANLSINAMIEKRFEEALKEAKELDEQSLHNNNKGALYGVPISVKESINVSNMKTTGGLQHRQDLIARQDAEVITKLKAAGAIILGKTNTPALCFSQETENKLYGRTNNPWDLTKTAGGSSGGEGALLAVGGAAAGIGSDIGGSIRIPAHFNGVIGFKPGMNQVSQEGHFPSVLNTFAERMLSIGPMGKSVQDMRFLYEIISNKSLKTKHLQNYKVEILPGTIEYPLSENMKEMLDTVETYLEKFFSIKRTVPPFFEDSAKLWQDILASDHNHILEQEAYNNDRSGVFKAFFREKLTERTSIRPSLSWGIFGSKLFKPNGKRTLEVKEIIEKGDKRLAEYLKNRLLIFPVYYQAAKEHGKVYHDIFSIRKTFLQYMPYVTYANVWGLPSLTIPIGVDDKQMPISIQIMSSIGNEDAIFRLGRLIEKRFRGYARCSYYD